MAKKKPAKKTTAKKAPKKPAKKKAEKKAPKKKAPEKAPEKKSAKKKDLAWEDLPINASVSEKKVEKPVEKKLPKKSVEKPLPKKPTVVPPKKGKITARWFDKLVNSAEKKVNVLPNQTKKIGEDALEFLKANKEKVLDLGEKAFREFMSLLSNGEPSKARDLFIKTKLGPDALIAQMRKSARAMKKAKDNKEAYEIQVGAFLTDISTFALRVLVSVLF